MSALLLTLLLAAPPQAYPPGEAELAQALQGRTAGKPLTCIDARRVETVEIIDRTAVIYRMPGGKLYVNRPNAGAAALERDATLTTRTYTPRLCAYDAATISRFGAMGFVMLGPFVPYSKAVLAPQGEHKAPEGP